MGSNTCVTRLRLRGRHAFREFVVCGAGVREGGREALRSERKVELAEAAQ